MAKKILVTVEYGENKTYSCYIETPIGDYALIDGDGNTVAEAKADFLRAVEECREAYPELAIVNLMRITKEKILVRCMVVCKKDVFLHANSVKA